MQWFLEFPLVVKRASSVIALVLFLAGASAARADAVVLIVGAQSPIHELDSVDVRRVFMGFHVISGGVPVRGARNRSDPRLDKIFLQNIVALSELVYERQLLNRRLREAGALPAEFAGENQLLDAVAHDPQMVGYAWAAAAAKRPDVRVLRILWHD